MAKIGRKFYFYGVLWRVCRKFGKIMGGKGLILYLVNPNFLTEIF